MNMDNIIKNQKSKIKNCLFLLVILASTACNFLDVDDFFNEQLKYDSIFTSKVNIERYMWSTADYFPNESNIFFGGTFTPGVTASDEAFALGNGYAGYALVNGTMTASNSQFNSFYNDMYIVIRKANTILARVHEVSMSSWDRNQIIGYTHFIRGYAYYNLLMAFGPVVIIGDDLLQTNADVEYYTRMRSTYDECVEYICNEFEESAKFIPPIVPLQSFGRPTRGAALAMIARLRLQHASPLFNGGSEARICYGGFTRSTDGVHYIRQIYDEELWAKAALAAKRVIDMELYELHTVEAFPTTPEFPDNVSKEPFPLGVGGIDPFSSYKDMFNGETVHTKNTEIIWGRNFSELNAFLMRCQPIGSYRGNNNFSIPQNIVDAYLMGDGRTIQQAGAEDPDYYNETGWSVEDTIFSVNPFTQAGYQIRQGVSAMYLNREMRFYANIGFSGYVFWGRTADNSSLHNQTISHEFGADHGKSAGGGNDGVNYLATGYVLRKYHHPDDFSPPPNNTVPGSRVVPKYFPIIRYAEIVLSYVEAINWLTREYQYTHELTGEPIIIKRDVDEIMYYFNMVRFRAGLPGIPREEAGDPQRVQELIERERLVEFMCENRRYFDVRRWGIYRSTERALMLGMNVDRDGLQYYTRVAINHRRARERQGSDNPKNILLPIPLNEVRKVEGFDQNPGWER